jgi:Escherichia/Staphylococcus phage prohead protease
MATPLHRVYPEATFRIRSESSGDGRTLVGLAVPYDEELDVSDWFDDYTEVFRKGAFAKTIRDRAKPVPLLVSHQHRALGIGRATALEETDAGLEAEFHLTEGVQAADEVLALVMDDAISGLSIGFEPIQQRETKGPARTPPSTRDLVERTEVALREVSVCNFPAYAGAGVTAVRAEDVARHPSIATLVAERARLHELRTSAVDRWGRVVRR